MNKVLLIFGTRPELIKLAPVIHEFENRGLRDSLIVINTNQHQSLVKESVKGFRLAIDYTLDIHNNYNNLSILCSEITNQLERLFEKIKQKDSIESVIVQGDTSTTYCASLVAFYNKIPVHYIEAGLRTFDNGQPFPEEFHRKVISQAAAYLYAPTGLARKNLLKEGFSVDKIIVSGNTIIDSIQLMEKMNGDDDSGFGQNTIICSIHRRENHGDNFSKYIDFICRVASENPTYQFIFISHPNPSVRKMLEKNCFQQSNNIKIIDPLPYSKMLNLIKSCSLIISDSGGLQEEASYFLKPVIILRNSTERSESIHRNISVCVHSNTNEISSLFSKMLVLKIDESNKHIYGTGNASVIIADNILRLKGSQGQPSE